MKFRIRELRKLKDSQSSAQGCKRYEVNLGPTNMHTSCVRSFRKSAFMNGLLVTELPLSRHASVSNPDGLFVCHGCSIWERDLFLCISKKSHIVEIFTQKLWDIPRSVSYFSKQLDCSMWVSQISKICYSKANNLRLLSLLLTKSPPEYL